VVLPALLVFTRNVLGGAAAVAPAAAADQTTTTTGKGSSNLATVSALGLVGVAAGALSQVRSVLRGLFSFDEATKTATRLRRLNARLRRFLLYLAGALFGPVAILAAGLVVMNGAATQASPSGREWAVWAGVALLTLVVLRFADITSWSMHPFYKRRLSSAFSVKRTTSTDGALTAREIDFREVLRLSDFDPGRMHVPFPELVICAAANVSDPGVTPPGSAITSFVFTPTVVGGPLVGGLLTPDYERRVGRRRRKDVTLPAAVAVSGAALAPAMGKETIAPLRMLLALANVRLGVWMPNPGRLPEDPTSLRPRMVPVNARPLYLLYEVLGRHRLRGRYLYVTDGGHYDNLGLVELIRRRCTTILCFDASAGPPTSYSALGEAIALARAEENVEIELDPTAMRPPRDSPAPVDHVTGRLRYPDGTVGTIVYAKAAVTSDSPWDVRAYAEKDPAFPAHPTAMQLYTGELFSAYQELGAVAARGAAEALHPLPPQG
jgi:hypothetical protein